MADPTPLRRLDSQEIRTPHEKILDLQKALDAERELAESRLIASLYAVSSELSNYWTQASKPGIGEDMRRLSETIDNVARRIDAIRGR